MPFFPASPHTISGMLGPDILDENITAVNLAAEPRKLFINDYGFLLYFDVQTLGLLTWMIGGFGQKKQEFIYRADIKSTEAEYINELAEELYDILICLQGEINPLFVWFVTHLCILSQLI